MPLPAGGAEKSRKPRAVSSRECVPELRVGAGYKGSFDFVPQARHSAQDATVCGRES